MQSQKEVMFENAVSAMIDMTFDTNVNVMFNFLRYHAQNYYVLDADQQDAFNAEVAKGESEEYYKFVALRFAKNGAFSINEDMN